MENKKFNPVGWFEIYVNDMERAKKFYETMLNVTLEPLPNPTDQPIEMWTFPNVMENPGAGGSLVKMEGFEAGGNSVIIYFACEDCAVEESRAKNAGGKIHCPKMSLGDYGFMSLVVDTEGNMIGLHSLK